MQLIKKMVRFWNFLGGSVAGEGGTQGAPAGRGGHQATPAVRRRLAARTDVTQIALVAFSPRALSPVSWTPVAWTSREVQHGRPDKGPIRSGIVPSGSR